MFAVLELILIRFYTRKDFKLNYILDLSRDPKNKRRKEEFDVSSTAEEPSGKQMLKESLNRFSVMYPGIVGKVVIINAPLKFRILWKVASLWRKSHSIILISD